MKYLFFTILLSSLFAIETLKANPSDDEVDSSSYDTTPRKVSSEEIEVTGIEPEDSEKPHKKPKTGKKREQLESVEEFEEIDIELGVHEKKHKKSAPEKRRESLEEFEDKYFQRMGKLFFILQRLSRFGNFGCLTLIGGISAYATWLDQQNNQNSSDCSSSTSTTTTPTALNLTVLFLTIASGGALGMDMYATNFLKEAKKKKEAD